jgi:hypothetical protein
MKNSSVLKVPLVPNVGIMGATSYCRPWPAARPPPLMRVWNSATGVPGVSDAPDVVQFFAVGPPPRVEAAGCRHLRLSADLTPVAPAVEGVANGRT